MKIRFSDESWQSFWVVNLLIVQGGTVNDKKKCSFCKTKQVIEITTPIYKFCSFECASSMASAVQIKQNKKKAQAFNRETRRLKESIKPKTKWLAELQAQVNKYVRLRDINDGCISCDKASDWVGQWHCGHYFSRGHSSSLRFNLWNMHKQCSVCNNHLSGNIGEYTPKLIDKIGMTRYKHLESHKSDIASYDIEWVKRAIKVAKKAVKRLEKTNVSRET